MNLNGKTALITGSSSGIGLAIARQLASCGCKLMLHGIDEPETVDKALSEIRSCGSPEVFFNNADLSQSNQAEGLIADTVDQLGVLDILVNNAGIQHVAPVDGFSDANWDKIIEVNLSAPFRLIRSALPVMRDNGWGRLINITSVHGLVASENKSAYVAAKHGLIGLTKTLALETATEPLTCNAICPGYVRTALVEAQISTKAQACSVSNEESAHMILQEKQPSLSFIEPADIGSMVTFLCSGAADQITGSTFTIDGGWTAQ